MIDPLADLLTPLAPDRPPVGTVVATAAVAGGVVSVTLPGGAVARGVACLNTRPADGARVLVLLAGTSPVVLGTLV